MALVGYIKSISDERLRSAIVRAYADSLGTVWLAITIASGIAFLASLFLESYSLDDLPASEGEGKIDEWLDN